MRKTDVLKTCRKSKFLGKKILRNGLALKIKKVQDIFGVFSCLLLTKPCLRFFWIWFAWEIKAFYQSSLESEVNFRDIMNVSPNLNFKKRRYGFADQRALITMNDIAPITMTRVFLSLESPCIFWLAKEKTWKRIFNTNSELSQNRTENQIVPFKIINWLFNDIWCHLFIACLTFFSKQL